MESRNSRQGRNRRGNDKQTSVVGSRLGESSSRYRGRVLPRGGIREQGSLSVAEGALPDSTIIGHVDGERMGKGVLKVIAIVSASLLVLLVVITIVFMILSRTSMFAVDTVEAVESEHVRAEDIEHLASIEEGTTLLNVDVAEVQNAIRKNPWVADVSVDRVFPSTLRISVRERVPRALVVMGTANVTWLLGDDGAWIEPVSYEAEEGESQSDAALTKAASINADLIKDVPLTVEPVAGSECTDESILAVLSFEEQFSPDFAKRVVSYSAPTADDISCVLDSGVEVALGSPTNVGTKEDLINSILKEYGGKVTYINVRVPSRPSYRYVDSPYVREGTGATGTAAVERQAEPLNATSEANETQEQDGNATSGMASDQSANGGWDETGTYGDESSSYGDGGAGYTEDQSDYGYNEYDLDAYSSTYGYDDSGYGESY